MRESVRPVLFALGAMVLAAVADARAQAPTKSKASGPAAGKAVAPARPPGFNQVVATVNGESITKGELIGFLSRYEIPPDNEERIYRDAVDTLVNNRLVEQFLSRQNIPVSEDQLKEAINQLQAQLKKDGRDMASALAESNTSMADVRKELSTRLRWIEYLKAKGTDAELKKFVANNKDMFNGTQVKASHIVLEVEPNATPAEKEKIRQKLSSIKKDIESNKMTFAEAANKYSQDPANAEGAGGDLGYFGRNSGFIEEFADAAFAMKKGSISDPVETVFGYHLIQVTDRKEGTPIDFDQKKPYILSMYAADLQKKLLTEVRKTAKIDIKPMPADLFPPAPVTTTPGTGAEKAAVPKDTPKR